VVKFGSESRMEVERLMLRLKRDTRSKPLLLPGLADRGSVIPGETTVSKTVR
jgi:hypothetical protein